jgi:5'-methylthioadenosine phosphorylase
MSIIGMTAAPEAFLAREAELCYATMAHVTDYDVWHVTAEPVSVEVVVQVLNRNCGIAQAAIANLARSLPSERSCTCNSALATALITNPAVISPEIRQKLGLLVDKYVR